ncbi:hypothetical protein P9B58_04490 [Bacillus mojavensis]|uniref:hypothetical protein n=1 Tax=Bacillus mojavensis TaxID=72360 RepID=UPI002DB7ED25|nr:hypothetical protein [Bacillus mojavensis]MEC1289534.1 hypothetical protein [Bacillus mojavensis]MEC1704575.1 hypothetical protein [Bacillus mojavensis]MEC5246073.1 hypothetical protein [Bacillus mojavensis]
MGKMDEVIVVAPRDKVFDNEKLVFQGIESDLDKVDQIIENLAESMADMRRGNAEENQNYKQPIPYAVLQKGDQVFAYKRLKKSGEMRLHDQLSIGVGGHMNAIEGTNFWEAVAENIRRELTEELFISTSNLNLEIVGLINDDLNEVGKVHLGVLLVVKLPETAEVSVRETDQLEGFWLHKNDFDNPEVLNRLESWSKYVADIIS